MSLTAEMPYRARRFTALLVGSLLIALIGPANSAAEPSYLDPERQALKECRYEASGGPAATEVFEARYGNHPSGVTAFGRCLESRAKIDARQLQLSQLQAVMQCSAQYPEQTGNQYENCVDQLTRELKTQLDQVDREQIRARRQAARDCARERDEIGIEAFNDLYTIPDEPFLVPFHNCVTEKASPPIP